jgi:hypothetical protein
VEGVARISSAVFVHANGLGSAFQVAIHSRTSFWLIHDDPVGVNCRVNRGCLVSQSRMAGVLWVAAPPEVADGHRAVRDRERSLAQPGAARKDRKARMRRWNYAPLRHDHRRQSAEIFVPL